jgi:hypothetical protein
MANSPTNGSACRSQLPPSAVFHRAMWTCGISANPMPPGPDTVPIGSPRRSGVPAASAPSSVTWNSASAWPLPRSIDRPPLLGSIQRTAPLTGEKTGAPAASASSRVMSSA